MGRREGINESVEKDVASIFKGKSATQLEALQKAIEVKLSRPEGIDIGYWESLLSQLKGIFKFKSLTAFFSNYDMRKLYSFLIAHMARARLRDRHQENLKKKLNILMAEQGVAKTENNAEPSTSDKQNDQKVDSEKSSSDSENTEAEENDE